MIKHKQNKKTSGIYSLPLKCDLCSTFSIKQKQRPFLDGCHTGSWCQPVWGRHSFQEGRDSVSNLLGLKPCLGLPAVLLLKMTQSKWSDVVLRKWLLCHHISEQTTQSHRHWVWESRSGWPYTQVRDVYLCEVRGGKQGSKAWRLLH